MRIIAGLAAAALSFIAAAHAQVRVERDTTSFVDPGSSEAARLLFGRSGYFMVAGGVVLGGTAAFYVERDGMDQALPPAAVEPVVNPDGSVALLYEGHAYRVGMPAGLACPLGRFVDRDGAIAYTVPKFMDPDSRQTMLRAGLRHHRIAREFDGTVFEPLLRAADFAATTPLPPALAQSLSERLNDANGLNGFVIDASATTQQAVGSLINTDVQVKYRVYLLPATQAVEIGGVPLRYFWELDRSGAAGVFAVDVFAQDWGPGAKLTDLGAPGAKPTQYDIVNFYQVAGLFRQLHQSVPSRFAAFVEQACGRPA